MLFNACFAVSSIVVEELDISEVRHSRIARSHLAQFHAVRPALILCLTPLIFLPLPVLLATKVRLSAVIVVSSGGSRRRRGCSHYRIIATF